MVKQSVYMQLVTPRVVPMAVSTAMSICKIVFQTSFFISFFLSFLVVNLSFAVLDEWQCSLSSNTVQRYKKNRQNAIVVLNHVHPYPGSRASLSRIPRIPLSSPSLWRCTANCIPTYRLLRRDVAGAASPRSFGGIVRTVTSCVTRASSFEKPLFRRLRYTASPFSF